MDLAGEVREGREAREAGRVLGSGDRANCKSSGILRLL